MAHQDESMSVFDVSKTVLSRAVATNYRIEKLLPKKPPPLRQIQEEFLWSRSEEFFAIRDPAERPFFFNRLFSRWFARWPEEKELFPGTPFYKLTPKQMAAVGVAVRKRRRVCF